MSEPTSTEAIQDARFHELRHALAAGRYRAARKLARRLRQDSDKETAQAAAALLQETELDRASVSLLLLCGLVFTGICAFCYL
ncbi:MAG: hypothetical protein MJD61_20310 [Proteobacteria bacterium]|nr:hypothetical protein [Pseudomonadota bacterium]